MNITFLGCVSSTLGLAALGIICGGLSAQAETTSTVAADPTVAPLVSQNQAFPAHANSASASTLAEVARSAANETSVTASSESTNQILDSQLVLEPSDTLSQDGNAVALDSTVEQSELIATTASNSASDQSTETALVPEAAAQASAANLIADPSDSQTLEDTSETVNPTVAQVIPPEVEPGGVTRSSPSYVGIGGNFGIAGDSALGNQSLAIFSKVGLTSFISARPSVVIDFDNDATFLIPLTFDLPTISPLGLPIGPYIGGGLAAATSDGVGGAIIAGIDAPITPRFTLNAGVNVGFVGDVDLGVQVGVGYNFFGF